jgi:hypothetical protein
VCVCVCVCPDQGLILHEQLIASTRMYEAQACVCWLSVAHVAKGP